MTMKRSMMASVLLAATLVSGCATPLNSLQKNELNTYRAKGLIVEEKHPGTGAALGILPGGGSFYTRHYGLGVVNLLLWPISILWDPISGHDGSEAINYYATKQHINKLKGKELAALEDKLELGQISNQKYVKEKNRIEEKYSGDI